MNGPNRTFAQLAAKVRFEPLLTNAAIAAFCPGRNLDTLERPAAVIGRSTKCCGAASPNLPFMHFAAFCRLERQLTEKLMIKLDWLNARSLLREAGLSGFRTIEILKITYDF